ncbi:MAG: MFS transporter [bacterium]
MASYNDSLQLVQKIVYLDMAYKQFLTWQLVLNWLTRVLFFTSLAALLPTLPLYLVDLGGNESQVGVVMSAFGLGVLLFRPVVGKQIDTLGRKIVLIFGVLVFIVSPILYIFIKSIAVLIPVRIFHGLGLAAFGTASITLITDAAPIEQRGEVISYTGVANTIAFSGGPILGTFLYDHWGFTVLFGVVSILASTCLLLSFLLEETRTQAFSSTRVSFKQAVFNRRILVAFCVVLLTALTHGGVMFFLPIFLKERLTINIGVFFTIYGLAALAVRFVVGRLSDRLGRGPIIIGALVCLTSGVFLLSQTTTVTLMVLSAIFYGMGFGSHQPTLSALVADNTTDETRGKIFSFYYAGFDLGISLAGILLGAVAEAKGIGNMIVLCSGLTVAALLIFTTLPEKSLGQSLRCAFSFNQPGKQCYICDQYMEVSAKQAEEYFKQTDK